MSKLQGIDSRRSWLAIGGLIVLAFLFGGCLGTAVFTPQATLMRFGVFNDTAVNNASLRWGSVRLDVGEYANKGDVESIEAVGNAITSGIMAYFTYGTAPAVKGAVEAALKPVATNAVKAVCAPSDTNCVPVDPALPAVDPNCKPQTPFVK